jgi:hypothetical protein
VVGNGRGARWRQFFARHAAARGAAVVAAYSVFFALFFSPVTAAGQ